MKVILINGSPAEKSHTYALLKYLQELLECKKIEVVFWDLREKPLPTVMPQYHRNPIETPDNTVKEFVRMIDSSDGIILGTPLYHGSFSGVLKNAIDNLAPDGFRNKIVGLVTNAGGARNTLACEHLRSVVRTLYGYATQTQIGTDKSDYSETKSEYVLIDNEIKERCVRLVEEITLLIDALAHNRALYN